MISAFAVSKLSGDRDDGVHLGWTSPWPAGFSQNGFSVWRRPLFQPSVNEECKTFEYAYMQNLNRMHRLSLDRWYLEYAEVPRPQPANHVARFAPWSRYKIDLPSYCDSLRVEADGVFAIGVRNHKATSRHNFLSDHCDIYVPGVDTVYVYATHPLDRLRVCCRTLGEDPWGDEHLIASGIQIPFHPVHPDVGSLADSQRVIESRLIPGETVDYGEFTRLYDAMSDAFRFDEVPIEKITQRHGKTSIGIETQIFGNLRGLSIVSEWRRGLGFGYFDPESDLRVHESYDYRITGDFLRRDLYESRHDFASVPLGTSLPLYFRTGPVEWYPGKAVVEALTPTASAPFETLIKGIRPRQLKVEFPQTTRCAVDLFGAASVTFLRNGATVGNATVSRSGRALLSNDGTFDGLRIRGEFFISAVIPQPVADASATETLSTTLRNVVFNDSPGPKPVHQIVARNLQSVDKESQQEMAGFEISIEPDATPWPEDLPYAPPLESWYWILERARDGGTFSPYDGERGWIIGARQFDRPVPPEGFGIDLEERFKVVTEPVAHSRFVQIDDTLQNIIDRRVDTPYGESFTYRATTIDAIGRRSPAVNSASVALQKWTRPPMPGGPKIDDDPDPRVGVRTRVIQRVDPKYPKDEATFAAEFPNDHRKLAGREAAIVLQWGWEDSSTIAETEGDRDPFVTEFRIYFRRDDYNMVHGRAISVARDGEFFLINVQLDDPVGRDALVAQSIDLGYPFRIVSHDAGDRIALRVHESNKTRATPRVGEFSLFRSDRDGGGPPNSWDDRIRVVPRVSGTTNYEVVLPGDLIAITPGDSLRGFLGVTAADDQSYVPDTITTGWFAGRVGNESYVSTAPIVAEYMGRPELPEFALPEIDRIELNKLRGEELRFELELSSWDPPTEIVGPIRIQRVSATALSRRFKNGTSVQLETDAGNVELIEATGDLIRQIRAGEIEDGWLAYVAHAFDFSSLWQTVYQGPWTTHTDVFGNVPARWFYRVQRSDEKGRTSENAWLIPIAVKVPDKSRPLVPELSRLIPAATDEMSLSVSLDLWGPNPTEPELLLFATSVVTETPRDLSAKMVRVANREDLSPTRTHRVRTEDGDLIEPLLLRPSDAARAFNEDRAVEQLIWDIPLVNPPGAELQVWVASYAHGTVSKLIGPRRLRSPEVV